MTAWQYSVLATVLLSIGGLVVGVALFKDHVRQLIRPRRRCPKCWYELSHSPGLMCSECGRTARSERRLRKARRRWGLATLGLVILLGGAVADRGEQATQSGWAAAVPTTAIIAALRTIEPTASPTAGFSAPRKPGFASKLAAELMARCTDDTLWRWQWYLLVERVLRDDPERLLPRPTQWDSWYGRILTQARIHGALSDSQLARADAASRLDFEMAEAWPIGAEITSIVTTRCWQRGDVAYTIKDRESGTLLLEGYFRDQRGMMISYLWMSWSDRQDVLTTAREGMDRLDVTIALVHHDGDQTWRLLREYDHVIPLSVAGTIEDHREPICSDEIAGALRSPVHPKLHVDSRERVWLEIDVENAIDALVDAGEPTLALRMEVMAGDEVLAVGRAWWPVERFSWLGKKDVWLPGGSNRVRMNVLSPLPEYGLVLRLTGDGETALRNRKCDSYWAGQVIVPVHLEYD